MFVVNLIIFIPIITLVISQSNLPCHYRPDKECKKFERCVPCTALFHRECKSCWSRTIRYRHQKHLQVNVLSVLSVIVDASRRLLWLNSNCSSANLNKVFKDFVIKLTWHTNKLDNLFLHNGALTSFLQASLCINTMRTSRFGENEVFVSRGSGCPLVNEVYRSLLDLMQVPVNVSANVH